MSYLFEDPMENFRELMKPLQDLAWTETPFDQNFCDRLPNGKAYDFDKIKDRVCAFRSKATKSLRSADAFLSVNEDSGAKYYFIDFKNQKVGNIQSVKDQGKNELIQKAFDSLLVMAMTFGRNVSMKEIQEHSVFIVVYPKQDFSVRFLEVLNQCADSRPLWNLDKLISNGFYQSVHTISDEDFSELSLKSNLFCESRREIRRADLTIAG